MRRAGRRSREPRLGAAVTEYLATLDHPESAATRRVYGYTLRALADRFGADMALTGFDEPAGAAAVSGWFEQCWGARAPATFNRNLDALRSAARHWQGQGWLHTDPTAALRRRARPADHTRALSRVDVEALLTRADIALRERVFWRLLYETAARAGEVLALDVDELDLPNRRARVTRKGGAADLIVWQTGTARLLPRLLHGRSIGPVFRTDRRARVPLPPVDLDPASGRARLSYRRAAELFAAATGGATLHQLRHSALTHAAEDGANTATLLAYSGHTTVASLARYARVSPDALARWQQRRDPARRKR